MTHIVLWYDVLSFYTPVQAIEYGYDVEILEPDTPWRFKVAELARYNQTNL